MTRRPVTRTMIAALAFASGTLFLVAVSWRSLRHPGSPLFGFENTAVLVTVGTYRYIRHPMYAAGLLLTWGAALKDLALPALGLAVIASGFLVATARAEEAENVVRFGAAYQAYMRRTRLFIPFLL